MQMPVLQRRRTGMILFAMGLLPLIAAALVIASAFMLPSVFRVVFALFIPPDVDAPDNWAVGMSRMMWLFVVSGSIGTIFCCTGLWFFLRKCE